MAEFGKPDHPGRKKGCKNGDPKRFAEAKVLKGMSATDAYIACRDDPIQTKKVRSSAYQFAHKPKVLAEIERLNKAAEQEIRATTGGVVAALEDIAYDESQKPEVRLQALDRLAKIKSMYSENVSISHAVVSMDDKKTAISEWIEGLNGEAEKPSEVGGGEPGKVDNGK